MNGVGTVAERCYSEIVTGGTNKALPGIFENFKMTK